MTQRLWQNHLRKNVQDFLVVQWKRILLPVQGHTDLIWSRRFHMPWSNWAGTPQLMKTPHSGANDPQLLSLVLQLQACAYLEPVFCKEKPLQWEAPALKWRVTPTHHNKIKCAYSIKDPAQPKINNKQKFLKSIKRNKNIFLKKESIAINAKIWT